MAKEHFIYWLSTETSGEDGVGGDCYYLKDAKREAQKLANELGECVYINQQEDIVDVIYPNEILKEPEERLAYSLILDEAAKLNISQKAVYKLLKFFTNKPKWGTDKAVTYMLELFTSGAIAEIKTMLSGKKQKEA